MKFTTSVPLLLWAICVGGAAIAEPFCFRKGDTCSKVKRAAEALAEAFAEPMAASHANPEAEPWCYHPGEPCPMAKRAADVLAAVVAESQPNPVQYLESLKMRDAFPSPDPVPDPDPEAFCYRVGSTCGKRRRDSKEFCNLPGGPCYKVKRAIAAMDEIFSEPNIGTKTKRDAEAEAACFTVGESCSKAKRDIYAITGAAAEALSLLA